jgi:sugar fermentation stimulation protein A
VPSAGQAADAPLVDAEFVARANRFIVRAVLADGDTVDAHLADPGRLVELLIPGARLRLRPAAPGSDRRTRFSAVLVQAPAPSRAWVSIETTQANRLAHGLLDAGQVQGIPGDGSLRREVACGDSRFDFLVERNDERCWVEVKSVTLVEEETGLFPDAPTQRGVRHVRELTQRVRLGDRACVLFVMQRHDARLVRPHRGIDPDLADALADASAAGVLLRAARFELDENAGASYLGPAPVEL